jgi:DNA modification methylase
MFHGDWLDAAMSLDDHSLDLVYADPPFNTGAPKSGEAGTFSDAWESLDAYIAWMRARVAATIPKIRATGSVLIHVDWRSSHRVRVMLDEVLGADRFVNHLVWSYGLGGSSPRRFARKHDDILFYCIDPDRYWFEAPRVPATSNRMRGMDKKATDVLDVPSINNMSAERVGWPTQKPVRLLEMLVGACCPAGGVVLDPCCGSGTTMVAAVRWGRRGLGADIDERALAITRARVAEAPTKTPQPGG